MPKNKIFDPTVLLIILFGIFIRFYRFVDLMNFSYGQGNALNLSGQMLANRRPALISQEFVIRKTASGHSFFHSGAYLYPIAPLQLIFNYDPVPITAVFAVFNLGSAIGLYFIAKKFLNRKIAFYTLILFMLSPVMVGYSRFIWHVNLLIPIITLALYYFFASRQKSKTNYYLLFGILSGLGFGIHIGFAIPGIFLFFWTLYHSIKYKKLIYLLVFLIGVLLGDLPVVIFDLRNHLYNIRTMFEFLFSLGHGTQEGSFAFESYHFISLLVPAFLLFGLILDRLGKKSILFPALILIIYLGYSANRWHLTAPYPVEMASGWNYAGLTKAADLIAADQPPSKYEIASIIDGETRSTNMRYLLTYLHHVPPLGVVDYPRAEVLYVIGRKDQNPTDYNVYEINSIKPVKLARSWLIQNDIYLYKLVPSSK